MERCCLFKVNEAKKYIGNLMNATAISEIWKFSQNLKVFLNIPSSVYPQMLAHPYDYSFFMTEKIANARTLICTTVQIKKEQKIGMLSDNHSQVIFSVI